VAPEEIDRIVCAAVLGQLHDFNQIAIDVVPPPGTPAASPVTVAVHAVYFINTPSARAHYAAARRQDYLSQGVDEFSELVRALDRRDSLLEPGHEDRRYSAGLAVQVGKATPEDVRRFVEEALKRGVIEGYARHQGRLSNRQQLTGLPPAMLAGLIQDWVADTGVGVDCSGFVLQAAIRARDAVRREAGRRGAPAPPEVNHKERYAVAFCEGPAVQSASELRPGDAWVLGTEHVRIVSSVLRVGDQIQFSSAESSGTSTSPSPGLVSRTWRTRDLERLHPIALAAGPASAAGGGSFHRIPQ
jgi:hypothetical protein